jgi:hypothetical protein
MLKTVTSSLLSLTRLVLISLSGQRLRVLKPPRSLLTELGEHMRELGLCDTELIHFITVTQSLSDHLTCCPVPL